MILKLINKLFFMKIISNYIFKKIKIKRQAEVNNMPKLSVEKRNIQNGSILSNREHLLEVLPKNGIIAELGVDNGYFTEQIIKISNPKKIYLIDTWSSKRYGQDKFELVNSGIIISELIILIIEAYFTRTNNLPINSVKILSLYIDEKN